MKDEDVAINFGVVDFQTKSDAFPLQPGGFPAINAAGWMSVAQIRALRQCSARSQSMRLKLPEQFPSGNQTYRWGLMAI